MNSVEITRVYGTIVEVPPITISFDLASFISADAHYLRSIGKEDILEKFGSKKSISNFYDLYQIPWNQEEMVHDVTPGSKTVTGKVSSFIQWGVRHPVRLPFVPAGKNPLEYMERGAIYGCECERVRYSNSRTSIYVDKHIKVFGNSLVDRLGADSMGMFGFDNRVAPIVGSTISYIGKNHDSMLNKYEINERFARKNLKLKEVIMQDFYPERRN